MFNKITSFGVGSEGQESGGAANLGLEVAETLGLNRRDALVVELGDLVLLGCL